MRKFKIINFSPPSTATSWWALGKIPEFLMNKPSSSIAFH